MLKQFGNNLGIVPEPGTLALLGLGAGALAMRRGRREERESRKIISYY